MTISIQFRGAADGAGGIFELCSVSGWAAFAAWARDLPEEFHALRELVEKGAAGPTDRLWVEIGAALERVPPSPSVRATAEAILERMGMGAEDEILAVVDEDAGEEGGALGAPEEVTGG